MPSFGTSPNTRSSRRQRLEKDALRELIGVLEDAESTLTLAPIDLAVSRALAQISRNAVPDMPDRIIAALRLA